MSALPISASAFLARFAGANRLSARMLTSAAMNSAFTPENI